MTTEYTLQLDAMMQDQDCHSGHCSGCAYYTAFGCGMQASDVGDGSY